MKKEFKFGNFNNLIKSKNSNSELDELLHFSLKERKSINCFARSWLMQFGEEHIVDMLCNVNPLCLRNGADNPMFCVMTREEKFKDTQLLETTKFAKDFLDRRIITKNEALLINETKSMYFQETFDHNKLNDYLREGSYYLKDIDSNGLRTYQFYKGQPSNQYSNLIINMKEDVCESFENLSLTQKRIYLGEKMGLKLEDFSQLNLKEDKADKMIENCYGCMKYPLGIIPKFVLNDKIYMVPLASEDNEFVNDLSKACSYLSENKISVETKCTRNIMRGQIFLRNVKNNEIGRILD